VMSLLETGILVFLVLGLVLTYVISKIFSKLSLLASGMIGGLIALISSTVFFICLIKSLRC
jgi:hypothetical protein